MHSKKFFSTFEKYFKFWLLSDIHAEVQKMDILRERDDFVPLCSESFDFYKPCAFSHESSVGA